MEAPVTATANFSRDLMLSGSGRHTYTPKDLKPPTFI